MPHPKKDRPSQLHWECDPCGATLAGRGLDWDALHAETSVRGPDAETVEASLLAVPRGKAWLCVARDASGQVRAAIAFGEVSRRVWRVLPTPAGPAWALHGPEFLPELFGCLPAVVRQVMATSLEPDFARRAETLGSLCLVRQQARGAGSSDTVADAQGLFSVVLFRDERAQVVYSMATTLKAWLCRPRRRAETGDEWGVQTLSLTEADERIWALFDDRDRISVQYGSAWIRNFGRTVDFKDAQPRLHVLLHRGCPVAAWPLLHPGTHAIGGSDVAALANYYTALWAPALAPGLTAADLVPLVLHVMKHGRHAGALRMSPMDGLGREYTLVRDAMQAAGLCVFETRCFGNWFLPAGSYDWPRFLSSRSAGLRSTLKRLGTKFQAEGGCMELIVGGDRVEAGIAAYEAVYRKSWKVPEPHPRFMPELIRLCSKNGWLRLGVAWMDEQPIAAQIWIVAHGRADIFKVAYDEAYSRLSIGSLLTGYLMQQVISVDRVQEVDFLMGDDPYKRNWMDARRERWELTGYQPRSPRGLFGVLRKMASAGRALWRSSRVGARSSTTGTTKVAGALGARSESAAQTRVPAADR